MPRLVLKRKEIRGAMAALLAILTSSCSLLGARNPQKSEAPSRRASQPSLVSEGEGSACAIANPLAVAMEKALNAATLAQSARTPPDWDSVVLQWMQAIAAMQSVPVTSPQRVFAQKKVTEYQQNLMAAQQNSAAKIPRPFDSFNSSFLDEQLLLFLSYVAAVGPPDVLVIGSSRAIQGVDVKQLQAELARQGRPNLRIFNFGINGATAQVVDFVLRELLTPEQLPQLIVWADGVRAFNSGRGDRTYNGIVASTGYQQLRIGNRPSLPQSEIQLDENCEQSQAFSIQHSTGWSNDPQIESHSPASKLNSLLALEGTSLPFDFNFWETKVARAADLNAIDANGFLPVSNRFDPTTYYQQFPRVAGRYDGDYQNFNLWGEQTVALKRLVAYTQAQQIPLVFVNLPLTQDYLDPARSRFEQQFRAFMQFLSNDLNFRFVDLARNPALQANNLFEDPSHLNRFGASAVARQLAVQPEIPWPNEPQPRRAGEAESAPLSDKPR
ncbi:MAG: hypothetical protein SW833_00860 [Cyanobacteriota bacterium]|nr:hypothetical protein [Cyanobacteriota bacterium]